MSKLNAAEIYARLMQAVRRSDILTVFGNLRAASQLRHLPAFERCAKHKHDGNHSGGQGRNFGSRQSS